MSTTQEPLTFMPLREAEWKCIQSTVYETRLHYSRFAASPFLRGQANTLGVALRRSLLAEVEGLSITSAKVKGAPHEYATLPGVRESVHDVLLNLKDIVLAGQISTPTYISVSFVGPGKFKARDLILPSSLQVVDPSQHIVSLTKGTEFSMELRVECGKGYRIQDPRYLENGILPVDAIFTPVRNVTYTIHSLRTAEPSDELLFFEVWTNGALTPSQALQEASQRLMCLFTPLLEIEKCPEIFNKPEDIPYNRPAFQVQKEPWLSENIAALQVPETCFIDQLDLPSRAYNCLKRSNIHTVADLRGKTEEDLLKIQHLGKKSVEQIVEALKTHFQITLAKGPLSPP
uniref:DNA-directed RNA polymerase subunit alpha n=1 Tax=Mesotaenium endlicherianum TaxID=184485 RepID=A0A024B3U5_9VIRI|nr:alpha subunit of RNA polymerase [Mesotaenium endlicherianum]AHZ11214.1 alpha subunit of RNA polymerase [Mesotaenium endlicherianum]